MTTDIPVTLRLRVVQPPSDVRWAVQLGRDALLPPVAAADDDILFEIPLTLGPNQRGTVQLRGAAVQGPPAARFVYVNSARGTAHAGSRWDRRAKVSLTSIDLTALQAMAPPVILEAAFQGTARDGGAACATVPLIGGAWTALVTASPTDRR